MRGEQPDGSVCVLPAVSHVMLRVAVKLGKGVCDLGLCGDECVITGCDVACGQCSCCDVR